MKGRICGLLLMSFGCIVACEESDWYEGDSAEDQWQEDAGAEEFGEPRGAQYKVDGPNFVWKIINGPDHQDVGAGGGVVYLTKTNGTIWRAHVSSGFYSPSQIGGLASRVTVNPANGLGWVVTSSGEIFEELSGYGWYSRSYGQLARDIGVGGGVVWIIDKNDYNSNGGNIYKRNVDWSTSWTRIPGQAHRIAVDNSGKAWVVNKVGTVYQYTDWGWVPRSNPNFANDIGVGADGSVYVVGRQGSGGYNRLLLYTGPTTDQTDNNWLALYQPNGLIANVAVNDYGRPIATRADYYFTYPIGVDCVTPESNCYVPSNKKTLILSINGCKPSDWKSTADLHQEGYYAAHDQGLLITDDNISPSERHEPWLKNMSVYPMSLRNQTNWHHTNGDKIGKNEINCLSAEISRDRIEDRINAMMDQNLGRDKSKYNLLLMGRSAGAFLIYDFLRRRWNSYSLTSFNKVAFVLVDTYGYLDRSAAEVANGTPSWYSGDGSDIHWCTSNSSTSKWQCAAVWPTDRNKLRGYLSAQNEDQMTGAKADNPEYFQEHYYQGGDCGATYGEWCNHNYSPNIRASWHTRNNLHRAFEWLLYK